MTGYESKKAMAQAKLDSMEREALKLALDLATMHHTDDGYAELRSKVRQFAKEALAQPAQEPVACDGDFPEGFDASLGVPAQALRVANAIMCDVIGKREWDVPCTAQHVLSFAKKYTTPSQRTWVDLTDEDIHNTVGYNETREMYQFALALIAKLKEKNSG